MFTKKKTYRYTHVIVLLLMLFSVTDAVSLAAEILNGGGDNGAKRSYIQSVDGYAYLSEDMTLGEIRELAFINAKKKALKMTSSYVQSKTTVENMVLKEDLLESSSEGLVTILEEKDFGIEDNDRYHVWIKAEISFEVEQKGYSGNQAVLTEVGYTGDELPADGPLTVQVWTSKKVYRPNETITVFIKGNRDFYARIVDITMDGTIVQLLPNSYRSDSFFKGGKVYRVPDGNDKFVMKVSPPYGTDRIAVYASDNPLGKVALEGIGNGLGLYRGSVEDLAIQTRGISVVSSPSENSTQGAEFFEQTWSFTTQPEVETE